MPPSLHRIRSRSYGSLGALTRHGGAVALVLGLRGLVACGGTDTPLGAAYDPLHGDACDPSKGDRNDCVCNGDVAHTGAVFKETGRWVCAGQNSVTCSSTYGSGGGRLLVNADMPCEMEWGSCSDGMSYHVDCDGLKCQCSVLGHLGRSWFTPRCTEMREANAQCGWSLRLPDGASMGVGPGQGHECEHEWEYDEATDCTCLEGAWDCAYAAGCRVSGDWHANGRYLHLAPYGTVLFRPSPGIPRDAILRQEAPGFVGTWQLAWPNLHFRSTHSPESPECDGTFATYALTMTEECSILGLTLVSDPCPARVAVLDGFMGVHVYAP
jgi:hypothetical protein